ncbi:MAG: hypothetical protein IPH07_24820 [Deltaproteobacteria bacterium]|nr:hypothetical protein [Deltaproteobacteria bacterium]
MSPESNGDGPGGSNPLRIAVAPTDDGVGLTTVQYRVVNGVTGTPLLDWTTLASPTAQLVPLYRASVTAPSIPALGTTTGLVRFEARAVDALGRTGPVSSRCWNQTLRRAHRDGRARRRRRHQRPHRLRQSGASASSTSPTPPRRSIRCR